MPRDGGRELPSSSTPPSPSGTAEGGEVGSGGRLQDTAGYDGIQQATAGNSGIQQDTAWICPSGRELQSPVDTAREPEGARREQSASSLRYIAYDPDELTDDIAYGPEGQSDEESPRITTSAPKQEMMDGTVQLKRISTFNLYAPNFEQSSSSCSQALSYEDDDDRLVRCAFWKLRRAPIALLAGSDAAAPALVYRCVAVLAALFVFSYWIFQTGHICLRALSTGACRYIAGLGGPSFSENVHYMSYSFATCGGVMQVTLWRYTYLMLQMDRAEVERSRLMARLRFGFMTTGTAIFVTGMVLGPSFGNRMLYAFCMAPVVGAVVYIRAVSLDLTRVKYVFFLTTTILGVLDVGTSLALGVRMASAWFGDGLEAGAQTHVIGSTGLLVCLCCCIDGYLTLFAKIRDPYICRHTWFHASVLLTEIPCGVASLLLATTWKELSVTEPPFTFLVEPDDDLNVAWVGIISLVLTLGVGALNIAEARFSLTSRLKRSRRVSVMVETASSYARQANPVPLVRKLGSRLWSTRSSLSSVKMGSSMELGMPPSVIGSARAATPPPRTPSGRRNSAPAGWRVQSTLSLGSAGSPADVGLLATDSGFNVTSINALHSINEIQQPPGASDGVPSPGGSGGVLSQSGGLGSSPPRSDGSDPRRSHSLIPAVLPAVPVAAQARPE